MSGYWSFRDTNRPQGGLKPMSAAVLPEGVRLAQEKNDNTGDVQLETEELHEFAPAAEASPLLLEVEVDCVVRNAQRDWWRARFGVVGFDPAAQEALEPLPCHQACDTGVSHVDPLSSSDAADAATARALISRADAILRSSSVEVQAPSHTQAVMGERRHGQSSAGQQQKGRIRKAAPDKKEKPPTTTTTTTTTTTSAPPRFLQRMTERAEARRQARESLHKRHNTVTEEVAAPGEEVKKEERGSSSDRVAATTPLEGKSTHNNKLADASFHALVQLIISDGHHDSNNNNHSPQVRKELHTVASHYHTAHTLRRTLRAWHGRFQSAAVRRTEWKAAAVKREQNVVRLLLEHTRVCQSVVCEEASSRSVVENAFRLEQRHQSLRDRSVHSQLVLARGYFTMWAEFCTHRERQRSALRYRKYLEECARGVLESMGH